MLEIPEIPQRPNAHQQRIENHLAIETPANFQGLVEAVDLNLKPYPHFDGWICMGQNSPIEYGDVAVLVGEHPDPFTNGHYKTPDDGLNINYAVGKTIIGCHNGDRNIHLWCVYRKVGNPLPRSNPHFSKPLPLP